MTTWPPDEPQSPVTYSTLPLERGVLARHSAVSGGSEEWSPSWAAAPVAVVATTARTAAASGPRRDLGHELDRAGAGAEDGHLAAGHVVVVPPLRGVEDGAGEGVEPLQPRYGGTAELSARRHQDLALVHAPAGQPQPPGPDNLVEVGALHLGREAHVAHDVEVGRDLAQVGVDLVLGGEAA